MNSKNRKISVEVIVAAIIAFLFFWKKAKAAPPTEPGLPEPGFASIWGIVTDSTTEKVIGAVVVSCNSYITNTETNGSYKIENIPKGNYTLTFTRSGYETVVKTNISITDLTRIDISMIPSPYISPPTGIKVERIEAIMPWVTLGNSVAIMAVLSKLEIPTDFETYTITCSINGERLTSNATFFPGDNTTPVWFNYVPTRLGSYTATVIDKTASFTVVEKK